MKIKILIFFTLVGILSSLLRFGDRENDRAEISDSDYYLDMAQVFAGQKTEFNQQLLRVAPHHYNRPVLPFCAGLLGHYLLKDNYSAAFSIINILSAILIACLFYIIITHFYPKLIYPWFPSFLFLTSFSQMDFGYHILTETIGLAFALGTCYLVYNLILLVERSTVDKKVSNSLFQDWRFYIYIVAIFIIQVLSFLTRETAWFVFIFLVYIVLKRGLYNRNYLLLVVLLFSVLVLAKIPQSIYSQLNNTHIPKFAINIAALFDPKYMLDAFIKLGLTFNISWLAVIPAIYYLKKNKINQINEFIIGWTLGALGYIAAGYVHNSVLTYGFPLRMFFALFPVVYLLVIEFFETKFKQPKLIYLLGFFIVCHVVIGVIGVILDSGTLNIHTIFDIFKVV